jgi:hypothetical protein
MSWKDPYRRRATAHDKFNLKDAVAYFRAEELEAVHVTGPCPHCHTPSLEFYSVDVDNRIELRIGAYRMALCMNCSAYCVIFAPVAADKNILKAGLLTHKKPTPAEVESDKKYHETIAAWYKQNGWTQ